MKYENKLKVCGDLQNELNALRPLSRNALKELKEYYKIGLTFSSNAIEGNSLTESETKIVLEDGITIGGKPLKDHYEAAGHAEAFELLYKLAKNKEITENDILRLHKLFYYRIDPKNAGRYRKKAVIITGSQLELPQPSDIKRMMQGFFAELPMLREKHHPVEFAALLHLRIATIHPFLDGNGRTARLVMNLALMQEGYPITIIPLVLRNDYIETLKMSDNGDSQPFINFISCAVYESQKEYLRLVRNLEKE